MKRLLYLLLIAPMVLMGCKKSVDAEPETIKLTVEPNSIISPSAGADYTLSLTSPGEWTATCAESWVKVSPASGKGGTVEVNVKISANKTGEETNTKILFQSEGQKVEVPVKRLAGEAAKLMIVSETEIKTPKDGGVYSVKVESNIKWQIASNASWAKIEGEAVKRNNGVISVTVDPATTPEETVATITVTPLEGSGVEKQTVTITRGSTDATELKTDVTSYKFESSGGTYRIYVKSNAKWKATKSWEMDWLRFADEATGIGNGSFLIEANPATSTNAVSGIITVEEIREDSYEPVKVQVLIEREGKASATLSVSKTEINTTSDGGTETIEIDCNYAWTASLAGTKIFSVNTTSGKAGKTNMVVTVKPSFDQEEATGTIIIKSSFGGEQAAIHIRRAPAPQPQLKLYPTQVNATAEGGEYVINVTANCRWRVWSSNTDIATVPEGYTAKSGKFTVTVKPSTMTTVSTAYIYIASEDGSATESLKVSREKYKTKLAEKPFSVSKNKKVIFSPGNLQFSQSTYQWSFADYQFDSYGLSAGIWELFVFASAEEPMTINVMGSLDDWHFWGGSAISYQGQTYAPGTWTTPTNDELTYLLSFRTNAANLRGAGTVNGTNGYILLPDDWKQPSGVKFVPGGYNYATNTYTTADWIKMEANGAVFLPATGYRYDYAVGNRGVEGLYWTNDIVTESADWNSVYLYPVYLKFFYNSNGEGNCKLEYNGGYKTNVGMCVRLYKKYTE